MAVSSAVYADANNSVPEYNENGSFNVTFQNVGSAAASNVTATLTCSTPGISVTDNTESITSLAAGASVTRNSAYAIAMANNIANGTSASFTITMVSGAETWTYNFSKTINAPALNFGNITISDPAGNNNGRLDPGESVTITIPLNNTGGAASPAGTGILTCSTIGITITGNSSAFAALAAAGNATLTFSLYAASSMEVGALANLSFSANAGAYSAQKNEAVTVGIILEDFATGNFNAFPWTMGGTANWTIDNSTSYSGTYSAKSGTITSSQTSSLQTVRVLSSEGSISFWYKVSSESGYDYLKFYVDGVQQNGSGWSGETAWTQATYTLAAGTRTLKWEYYKDSSVDGGSDCAWIDYIIFPASTSPSIYNPPQNLAAIPSHQKVILTWSAPASGTPTGYKVYRNSALLATATELTYSDTSVSNGTSYSYYLKAVYSGGESDPTGTVSATPNLSAPTGLTATAGNGFVNLSWTAATGLRNISGYNIYRNSNLITSVTGTTYQDNNVVNEVTYTYSVSTVYSSPAGESAASASIQATPTANVPTTAVIGSGTAITGTTTASPINIYYKSLHGQSIYTAAELNAAGVFGPIYITQVGFYISTAPSLALPSFLIRMKHTTDANVTNWQTATGMTTVYTNASYMPVAGGFEMLTLSQPYLWNGTDNLVVDTAFGLLSAYTSTGTLQYTTVTNGYRYVRSDTVDETSIFTDGSTSTYRPNIKLALLPYRVNPEIGIAPDSLDFGTQNVQSQTYQQFTISNTGNATLIGNITTPAGYTVAVARKSTAREEARSKNSRNELPFSIAQGSNQSFSVCFNPTTGQSYNGNLTITCNDTTNATVLLPVSGSGIITVFNPPTGLSFNISHATVNLTWTPPIGSTGTLSGYNVFRNGIQINSSLVTNAAYQDTGLTNGTSYEYYVTAVYAAPAGQSVPSATVTASPMAYPPQNLNGLGDSNKVILSWNAPSVGTPTSYRVYRNGTFLRNTYALSITDLAVTNGISYTYNVRAIYINPYYESAASNTITVTPNLLLSVVSDTLSGQSLPMDNYQGYTYSQSIYLQSQLNQSGKTIEKIYWHYGGGTSFTDAVKVYMGHTSISSFASISSWIPLSGLTLVYNGNITTPSAEGWVELPLTTQFAYNNVDNLVIAVDENTSGWHLDTDEFLCSSSAANRSLVFVSKFTNPDPAAPPTTGTNLTLKMAVPQLKLKLINTPQPVLSIIPSSLSYGNVILGNSSNLSFTLQNTTSIPLTGTITTPEGYTVTTAGREGVRNVLNFSLTGLQSVQYNVSFAPQAVQSYNGYITIACNDANLSTYQVSVAGTGYVPPTALLNLTAMEATLADTESQTQPFTICNNGSQDLNYSLEIEGSPAWLSCSPMSATVQNSVCFQVNVQFSALGMTPGTYTTNIYVNSNDPVNPRQAIACTLNVYKVNHAPAINLPESFTFNKNESLQVDFSTYVYDQDNDPLTISVFAMRSLDVIVQDLQVTLSSSQNWYGSNMVTFMVSDGQYSALDSTNVIVLPTQVPNWIPVTYPFNSATVYADVALDGNWVDQNDQIAAFVGSECRGVGSIVFNGGIAYTTLLVNIASETDSVIFRLYDASADVIYQTANPRHLTFGEILGSPIVYNLRFSSIAHLDAPVVMFEPVAQGIKLSWEAVSNANQYLIYASEDPYNGFSQIAVVTAPEFIDTSVHPTYFYKVIASDGVYSRGGAK